MIVFISHKRLWKSWCYKLMFILLYISFRFLIYFSKRKIECAKVHTYRTAPFLWCIHTFEGVIYLDWQLLSRKKGTYKKKMNKAHTRCCQIDIVRRLFNSIIYTHIVIEVKKKKILNRNKNMINIELYYDTFHRQIFFFKDEKNPLDSNEFFS